ncbi:hypothetical protein [Sporomusa aerivorans]|uniref:hypothetical protein n=1 Tax=Sporomusa aerivorans TaxID=204936 RepID=UPI00352A7E96
MNDLTKSVMERQGGYRPTNGEMPPPPKVEGSAVLHSTKIKVIESMIRLTPEEIAISSVGYAPPETSDEIGHWVLHFKNGLRIHLFADGTQQAELKIR